MAANQLRIAEPWTPSPRRRRDGGRRRSAPPLTPVASSRGRTPRSAPSRIYLPRPAGRISWQEIDWAPPPLERPPIQAPLIPVAWRTEIVLKQGSKPLPNLVVHQKQPQPRSAKKATSVNENEYTVEAKSSNNKAMKGKRGWRTDLKGSSGEFNSRESEGVDWLFK